MLIVVTGGARSGKTTLGSELGRRLGLPFLDAARLAELSEEERARVRQGGVVLALASTSHADEAELAASQPQLRVVLKISATDAERRGATQTSSEPLIEPSAALLLPATLAPTEIVERVLRRLIALGHPGGHRLHFAEGSRYSVIDNQRAAQLVDELLARLGPLRRVLLVPLAFR